MYSVSSVVPSGPGLRLPPARRPPRRERAAPQADDVVRTLGRELGTRLRRIPDGETGPRADWIVWKYPVLLDVIFGGRPTFNCCWTYVTASKVAATS